MKKSARKPVATGPSRAKATAAKSAARSAKTTKTPAAKKVATRPAPRVAGKAPRTASRRGPAFQVACAYFGNRILRHAIADMRELRKLGYTTVIHTLSENDVRFFHRAVCDIVEATRDEGLDPWIDPWGVGRVFGGEAFSAFSEENSPGSVEILSDGMPGHLACPNAPKFREYMKFWVSKAVETGASTIFWDEPHFYLPGWMGGRPNTWGCLCKECRRLFQERTGKPMPSTETDDVKAFKKASLVDFLQFCVDEAAQAGRRNALCVLPHDKPETVIESWRPFANMRGLDVFGTDPYWLAAKQHVDTVGQYSAAVEKLCRETGREAQVWIQGFGIPHAREGEVAEAIRQAADAGVRNIAVWGFDACAHLSWVRPENPASAWKVINTALRKAVAKAATKK